jgi:uncharacterized protein YaeQ
MQNKLIKPTSLQVWRIPSHASQDLAKLAERSMQLQATVQEGVVMMSNGVNTVDIECERWK